MNELQLNEYCKKHPHCDRECVNCKAFAAYQRHELGIEDYDEELD